MVRNNLFALVLILFAINGVPHDAGAQVSVEGAWTVTQWTQDGETWQAQPGIFLFTSTHSSFFFLNGPNPRAVPAEPGPGPLTDAEKLTAFDEFTANAGRYTVTGNTLVTMPYVAKNPRVMSGFPDNAGETTFHRNGDTLTLTFRNGSEATLVRREGQPARG